MPASHRFERLVTGLNGLWWRPVPVVSLAAAVIGVALSLLAWQVSLQREDRLARQDFDALASDRFVLLQNGIDQYVNDIAALRAVFQAFEPGIDRQQFRRFSDDLFRDKNAILSASWAPRVTRDQRADFEIKATRDGLAGYRIKSIAADGTLSTAGEAAEYFPVFYLSKGEPGTTVYGIDINDGDIRQRALERARDEDRAAATANFVLRRGVGDRTGFLVCPCTSRACLTTPWRIAAGIYPASSKACSKSAS